MPNTEITLPTFTCPAVGRKFEHLQKALAAVPAAITMTSSHGNRISMKADMQTVGKLPLRLSIEFNGKSGAAKITGISTIVDGAEQPSNRDFLRFNVDSFLAKEIGFADGLTRTPWKRPEPAEKKVEAVATPAPAAAPMIEEARFGPAEGQTGLDWLLNGERLAPFVYDPNAAAERSSIALPIQNDAPMKAIGFEEFAKSNGALPASSDLYGRDFLFEGSRQLLGFTVTAHAPDTNVRFGIEVRLIGDIVDSVPLVETVEKELVYPSGSILDDEEDQPIIPDSMKSGFVSMNTAVDNLVASLPNRPEVIDVGLMMETGKIEPTELVTPEQKTTSKKARPAISGSRVPPPPASIGMRPNH